MYKFKLLVYTALFISVTAAPASADLFLEIPVVEPVWNLEKYLMLSDLWDKTDDYWHQGDYENCIRTLKEIIKIDKTQTEAYSNAAWLLESTNHTFEGFDLLVQNVLSNPHDCTAHFELGTKHYFFGNYDEAVRKLEVSVAYGCSTVVERMLGHAYERAGEREKAIRAFACVLGKEPDDGAALNNMIRILKRIPPQHNPTRLWHRPDPYPQQFN